MLFACLKEAPTSNKVVVMGEFNAELSNVWQEQGGVIGKFHLHQAATKPFDNPSDNGPHLLNLATTFHLRTTNTFFKHLLGHLVTWQHVRHPLLVCHFDLW
jgi:hypothetical protein